jgi:heavy metal translocating P-type ATPase
MLLSLIITYGAVYAGMKIYQQRHQKKLSKASKNCQKTTPKSQKEIADLQKQSTQHKQRINRNIIISGVTFGVLNVAALTYPPIQFLAIPVILYTCIPVIQKAFKKLKQGVFGGDALVVLVFLGALLYGYILLACSVIFIFSIAEKFVLKVRDDSHNKLVNVFQQVPHFVWIVVDDVELRIPFHELKQGDIVIVHAGEVIPADGSITAGVASVDQHILTGEARPVDKAVGDEVFASTTLLSGQIYLQVEKAGETTTVAKIVQVLNNTIDFKSSVELKAETLADKSALPTLVMGSLAFQVLGSSGGLAVLGSHFKNKLRLVASLGTLNYLNVASKNSILIKDGRSLELLKQVDTIVFDKTGTLTEEQPTVGVIHACADYHEQDILRYAVAAEYKQTHPIAKALIQKAAERGLSIPSIEETEYQVGYGLTVRVEEKTVRVGSQRFMEMVNIKMPPTFQQIENTCYREGHSLIMVAIDEQLIGAIELLPTIRPEAKTIIQELCQNPQIQSTYIISGDHETPTRKLAEVLGIDHYFAETLPEKKAEIIEQLQQAGKFICYIGDGINDAIALKKSHVSISLRGASTVATDTAQIILLDQGLNQLSLLFELAKSFNQNMDTSVALVVTPTIVGIGGAYLLGLGLGSIVLLQMIALLSGTGNAMLPLLYKPSKKVIPMDSAMTEGHTSFENNQKSKT